MLTEADLTLHQQLSDAEVVARVLDGDVALYELIMRRYNRRLHRVARTILGDATEAEDVMQDAYVKAFTHLSQYTGAALFSTWLTKIAVYEALARKQRRSRMAEVVVFPEWESLAMDSKADPEQDMIREELSWSLQFAIEKLPENYRTAFVLKEVEGMSILDVAQCLDISEENAKVRVHRARLLLRRSLYLLFGKALSSYFDFHLSRCDRVVAAVMQRIRFEQKA